MNPWLLAIVLILPSMALPIVTAIRDELGARLAAVQLAGAIAPLLLVMMTFVSAQASSIDLALALAFLSLPAWFLFAVFFERWL